MTEPHIAIRLDAEDRALLEACSKYEKLTKSDIVRRAVRAYALTLGIKPEPMAAKRKTKRK